MKSKRVKLRVLLDTSFLLPTLGISVGEEVLRGLKSLAATQAEIHYSSFSILESLWVAARTLQNATFDIESFKLGLRSIMESGRYKETEENSEVFNEALRLYKLGHKDMVDNILYATSTQLTLRLLTLDSNLRKFICDRELKDTLISSDQVAAL